jgi:hypothetical protein
MRYCAVKVKSDFPNRYRIVGFAKPDDKTDQSTAPNHPVVIIENERNWCPVFTLSRGGLSGLYVTDKHGINVEQ